MIDRQTAELIVQGRDVPWLLDQWVQRTPDKTFLIWAPADGEHRQWTYAQFQRDVNNAAAGLAALGLRKGQHLLIHLENCPEYLITYFACAQLGVVSVMTNTRAVPREMQHYCQSADITAAVTQPKFIPLLQQAAPNLGFIAVTNDNAGEPCNPMEACYREPRAILFENLMIPQSRPPQSGRSDFSPTSNPPPESRRSDFSPTSNPPQNADGRVETRPTRTPNPHADLRIQFTSGTTSLPKAVLSTHANAIFAAQQTALAYALTDNDVCQVFVPLFHNNGLSTLVTSTLWAGGTVLLQRKFSASTFWELALEYKATWTSLPGAFFSNALLKQPVPDHHFRFWFAGITPEVAEHFKVKTRWHWGMTEMIALPLVGDPHHSGPNNCIGRPIPGIEIAIRRADGTPCGPGETGALYARGIRGITIFKEYLNNPEANEKSFDQDGWFDTGDRIRIDDQGHLFFADRGKDMLRVGGENVAASEIEAVIKQSGWVKECAVVGQKHTMLDEVPVAFVIPEQNAPEPLKEKLIDHCRSQLADFKVIRDVHIVDDFPRSTLAKIAKHKLRENLPELQE